MFSIMLVTDFKSCDVHSHLKREHAISGSSKYRKLKKINHSKIMVFFTAVLAFTFTKLSELLILAFLKREGRGKFNTSVIGSFGF